MDRTRLSLSLVIDRSGVIELWLAKACYVAPGLAVCKTLASSGNAVPTVVRGAYGSDAFHRVFHSIRRANCAPKTLAYHFQNRGRRRARGTPTTKMAAAVARFEGAMGIPKQPGVTHPTPGLLHQMTSTPWLVDKLRPRRIGTLLSTCACRAASCRPTRSSPKTPSRR